VYFISILAQTEQQLKPVKSSYSIWHFCKIALKQQCFSKSHLNTSRRRRNLRIPLYIYFYCKYIAPLSKLTPLQNTKRKTLKYKNSTEMNFLFLFIIFLRLLDYLRVFLFSDIFSYIFVLNFFSYSFCTFSYTIETFQ